MQSIAEHLYRYLGVPETIKKKKAGVSLALKPTDDILSWTAKQKCEGQYVVGFALENKKLRANAKKKLADKRLDMIIANTPESIAAEKAAVQIKTPDSRWLKLPIMPKRNAARRVIQLIDKRLIVADRGASKNIYNIYPFGIIGQECHRSLYKAHF